MAVSLIELGIYELIRADNELKLKRMCKKYLLVSDEAVAHIVSCREKSYSCQSDAH